MSTVTNEADTERGGARRFRGGRRLPVESVASIGLLLLVWWFIAGRTPDYIAPQPTAVLAFIWNIVSDTQLLWHAFITILRIMVGLVLAFVFGTALGLAMGWRKSVERFSMPLLQMAQGVPSVSWVLIGVIWFQTQEIRIAFILVIVTLPGFAFQALDSYRAIPKELRDMARSLRPRRFDTFRTLTWPAVVPDLLTAWKVNVGLGTRVVLIAELVGAPLGVGYMLLVQQQRFDIAGVIAWTGVLVLFVLAAQFVVERFERRLLRYRPNAVPDRDEGRSSRRREPASV